MSLVGLIFAVFSILGSVFGAGFMSGTEIYGFFARFGSVGYITIALNAVIFGLFVFIYGVKTAKNAVFCPETQQKHRILYFCQLLITGTMVAGACEILVAFGVSAFWVHIIVLCFVFICNLLGIKSANFFNCLVTMLAIVCFSFVAYDGSWQPLVWSDQSFMPLVMVMFYFIMNIASSEPIVKSVCREKSRKQIFWIGFVVCLLLAGIMYLLVGLVGDGSMPLISSIKKASFQKVYSVVVMLAMVSTMLSSSVGAKRLFGFGNFYASFFVAILSAIISFVGFRNMVLYVYPLIGLLLGINYITRKINQFLHTKA